MNSDALEAIYRANVGASFQDALRAVYTHGFYDGAGTTIAVGLPDKSASQTAPSIILKLPFKGKG